MINYNVTIDNDFVDCVQDKKNCVHKTTCGR